MFYIATGSSPVTVADALAMAKQYPRTKISIADTNENINNNLDALQKVVNNITSIGLTDVTQALTVTAAQLKKNANIIGKISGNYLLNVKNVAAANAGSVASNIRVAAIDVADSSSAVANNIALLSGNNKISQITQTGTVSPLALTAAQYADNTTGLAKIVGSYSVAISGATATQATSYTNNPLIKSVAILDTSSNIASKLDDLMNLGLRIKEIRTSQNSTMTVTADQVKKDAFVLGKIYSNYQLAVINTTAVQMASIASHKKVVSIDIADTGSNVIRNMAFLKKLGTELNSITITDVATPLSITADQWAVNESVIGKINTPNLKLAVTDVGATYAEALANNSLVASISVKDSSTNIASKLVALNTNSKLTSITQTGALQAMTLTEAQLATTDVARGKIVGDYSLNVTGVGVTSAKALADSNSRILSMSLSGSAADVVSKLNDINALGEKVGSITQSDSGTALALTSSQWMNLSKPLDKITGGYRATVSGVTAVQAIEIATDGHISSVQVSDTAANLKLNLNALQTLGAQISGVTNSDSGAISITASQLSVNSGVLAKFDNLSMEITEVAAANAAALESNDQITAIHVSDSSANIALKLDTLDANTKLSSITQTGTLAPMNITASQLSSRATTLAKINGGYSLAVSGVAVANAATVAANSKVVSMAVSGAGSDIVANLSSLNSLGKKITAMVQSDPVNSLALSSAQWIGQAAALNKITGGFRASVADVAADKAQSIASDSRVLSVAIKDTGASISKQLQTLQSLGARISTIEKSDQGSLTVSASQWLSSQQTLAKFTSVPNVVVNFATAQLLEILSELSVKPMDLTLAESAIKAVNELTCAWVTLISGATANLPKLLA